MIAPYRKQHTKAAEGSARVNDAGRERCERTYQHYVQDTQADSAYAAKLERSPECAAPAKFKCGIDCAAAKQGVHHPHRDTERVRRRRSGHHTAKQHQQCGNGERAENRLAAPDRKRELVLREYSPEPGENEHSTKLYHSRSHITHQRISKQRAREHRQDIPARQHRSSDVHRRGEVKYPAEARHKPPQHRSSRCEGSAVAAKPAYHHCFYLFHFTQHLSYSFVFTVL